MVDKVPRWLERDITMVGKDYRVVGKGARMVEFQMGA
jgi:hypothetical protein